jgi:hypothetical protein
MITRPETSRRMSNKTPYYVFDPLRILEVRGKAVVLGSNLAAVDGVEAEQSNRSTHAEPELTVSTAVLT